KAAPRPDERAPGPPEERPEKKGSDPLRLGGQTPFFPAARLALAVRLERHPPCVPRSWCWKKGRSSPAAPHRNLTSFPDAEQCQGLLFLRSPLTAQVCNQGRESSNGYVQALIQGANKIRMGMVIFILVVRERLVDHCFGDVLPRQFLEKTKIEHAHAIVRVRPVEFEDAARKRF